MAAPRLPPVAGTSRCTGGGGVAGRTWTTGGAVGASSISMPGSRVGVRVGAAVVTPCASDRSEGWAWACCCTGRGSMRTGAGASRSASTSVSSSSWTSTRETTGAASARWARWSVAKLTTRASEVRSMTGVTSWREVEDHARDRPGERLELRHADALDDAAFDRHRGARRCG